MDILLDNLGKEYTMKWMGMFGKNEEKFFNKITDIYSTLTSFDSLNKIVVINGNKCAWLVLRRMDTENALFSNLNRRSRIQQH